MAVTGNTTTRRSAQQPKRASRSAHGLAITRRSTGQSMQNRRGAAMPTAAMQSTDSEISEASSLDEMEVAAIVSNFGVRRASDLEWQSSIEASMVFRNAEEQTLLRASALSTVMRSQAAIFAESKGSAATYQLSQRVERIDAFISHNWSVPRLDKFLCLAWLFNWVYAWTAVLIYQVSVTACFSLGILGPDGFSLWILFGTSPVFIIVLCLAREPCARMGFPGPYVFLDKTCIHQEDRHLQTQGIRKLGAFLNKSSTMLVLFSDVYLEKLWTVYEVASYIALRGVDGMTLLPIFVPKVMLVTHLIGVGANAVRVLVVLPEFALKVVGVVGTVIVVTLFMYLMRWYARYLSKARERVMVFDMEQCTCFCEDDRPLVYHNIASLMRTIGTVNQEATMEEALAAFSLGVRELLPTAFRHSLGYSGLTYSLVLSGTYFFCTVPQLLVLVRSDADMPHLMSEALFRTVSTLTVIPLKILVIAQICDFRLDLHGVKEFMMLEASALLCGLIDLFLPCLHVYECGVTFGHVVLACMSILATMAMYSESRPAVCIRKALWGLIAGFLALCKCLCCRRLHKSELEMTSAQVALAAAAAEDHKRSMSAEAVLATTQPDRSTREVAF